jgi:hypothetical protein
MAKLVLRLLVLIQVAVIGVPVALTYEFVAERGLLRGSLIWRGLLIVGAYCPISVVVSLLAQILIGFVSGLTLRWVASGRVLDEPNMPNVECCQ